MNLFELIQTIRENGIQTPVIVLTSLTDIDDLSRGYELGCNDYLRKPFDLIELKYRIEQIIKSQCFGTSEDVIKLYDDYSFDVKTNTLYENEVIIELTQKERNLVSLLIQNRGVYVSIETLHEVIWENRDILYADIRMCIKRIRNKTNKDFIKTKRFVGYKIDK